MCFWCTVCCFGWLSRWPGEAERPVAQGGWETRQGLRAWSRRQSCWLGGELGGDAASTGPAIQAPGLLLPPGSASLLASVSRSPLPDPAQAQTSLPLPGLCREWAESTASAAVGDPRPPPRACPSFSSLKVTSPHGTVFVPALSRGPTPAHPSSRRLISTVSGN